MRRVPTVCNTGRPMPVRLTEMESRQRSRSPSRSVQLVQPSVRRLCAGCLIIYRYYHTTVCKAFRRRRRCDCLKLLLCRSLQTTQYTPNAAQTCVKVVNTHLPGSCDNSGLLMIMSDLMFCLSDRGSMRTLTCFYLCSSAKSTLTQLIC